MHSNELSRCLNTLVGEEKDLFSYYHTAGNKIVTEISELLQTSGNGKFSISRKIIAGSMGKHTALGWESEPDFDVVLFVINETPPLEWVAEEFYQILKNRAGRILNLRKTRYSVQFSVKKWLQLPRKVPKEVQFQFDMLPAADLSPNNNKQQQVLKSLELIRITGSPEANWYPYSSGLSEATVKFVQDLPEKQHGVITLAKLWNDELKEVTKKNEGKLSYFSGRSSLVELVAIRAGQIEPTTSSYTFEAFRQFLTFMAKEYTG